jgi:hypothetical protein
VTSSVSGKRSPAELIARDPSRRWRRESNPCARLCRPLPHHSATPPLGLMRLHHRADDGIRTRDPNLGKVVRYQLRHVRTPRASSSPIAKHDDSASTLGTTNPWIATENGAQRSGRDCRWLAKPRSTIPEGRSRRGVRFDGEFWPHSTSVLVFDLVRCALGLVAQWESVRLTRGRSLVRYQPGPPRKNRQPVEAMAGPPGGTDRRASEPPFVHQIRQNIGYLLLQNAFR